MKKLAIMMALVLASTCGYAQKKAVNSAKNKASNTESPDFAGAREDIKAALENETPCKEQKVPSLQPTWTICL